MCGVQKIMATMTVKNIATMGETYANAIDNLAKGETYAKTFEGATGIITKYWNKGYGDAAKALGFDRPKALKTYVKEFLKGKDVHPSMYAQDKDGNLTLGVWGTKNLEDTTVEPIVDARGKNTYPLVLDEKGKSVKVDVIRPISGLTPKTIFTLILQNEAMKAGALPFTQEMGLAMYVTAKAETEPIPTAAPIPTGKAKPEPKAKGGKKNGKKAA